MGERPFFPLPRAWPFVNVGAADMPIGCARTFSSSAPLACSFKQTKPRGKHVFARRAQKVARRPDYFLARDGGAEIYD